MTFGLKGDWAKLAKTLVKHGWRIEQRSRHVFALAPDGKAMVGISPGDKDFHAMKNTCARLRRAGAPV